MNIDWTRLSKHALSFKRPALKEQSSFAGIETAQASAANASARLCMFQLGFVSKLITPCLL
jgi:hypothetical protein